MNIRQPTTKVHTACPEVGQLRAPTRTRFDRRTINIMSTPKRRFFVAGVILNVFPCDTHAVRVKTSKITTGSDTFKMIKRDLTTPDVQLSSGFPVNQTSDQATCNRRSCRTMKRPIKYKANGPHTTRKRRFKYFSHATDEQAEKRNKLLQTVL